MNEEKIALPSEKKNLIPLFILILPKYLQNQNKSRIRLGYISKVFWEHNAHVYFF